LIAQSGTCDERKAEFLLWEAELMKVKQAIRPIVLYEALTIQFTSFTMSPTKDIILDG